MKLWVILSLTIIYFLGLSLALPDIEKIQDVIEKFIHKRKAGYAEERGRLPNLEPGFGLNGARQNLISGNVQEKIPLYPVKKLDSGSKSKRNSDGIDVDLKTPIGDINLDIGNIRNRRSDKDKVEVPEIPEIKVPEIPEIKIPDIKIPEIPEINIKKRSSSDESNFPPIGDGVDQGEISDKTKRDFDLGKMGDIELGYGRDHRSVNEEDIPVIGEGTDKTDDIKSKRFISFDSPFGGIKIGKRDIPLPEEESWPPVTGQKRNNNPSVDSADIAKKLQERGLVEINTPLGGIKIGKREIPFPRDDKWPPVIGEVEIKNKRAIDFGKIGDIELGYGRDH